MGFYLRQCRFVRRVAQLKVGWLIVVSGLSLALTFFLSTTGLGMVNISNLTFGSPLLYYGCALLGSWGVITLAIFLSRAHIPYCSLCLRALGHNSLVVFSLHSFYLYALLELASCIYGYDMTLMVNVPKTVVVIGFAAGTAILTCIAFACERVRDVSRHLRSDGGDKILKMPRSSDDTGNIDLRVRGEEARASASVWMAAETSFQRKPTYIGANNSAQESSGRRPICPNMDDAQGDTGGCEGRGRLFNYEEPYNKADRRRPVGIKRDSRLLGIRVAAVWLIPAATLAFIAANLITRSAFLDSYFIPDWSDTFMDYFNMLENVRIGDPYYINSNYPPLNFIILKVLFHLVPHSSLISLDTPSEEAHALRNLMPAMMGFLLLTMVCLLVIALCVWRILHASSPRIRASAVVATLFCGPTLFLLERGNLLMLAFAATMVFFAFWRSEKAWQRRMACAALAFAAALKLYPAVFLLLLLRDRRLKEFFATAALFFVLLVAPFFAFGGPYAASRFVSGIAISSSMDQGLGYNYSLSNLLRILSFMLGAGNVDFGVAPSLVAGIICLVTFVLARRDWQRAFACGVMCVWIPAFSYTYGLVMLIPAFLQVIRDEQLLKNRDTLSLILLSILMMPLITAHVDNIAALLPDAKLPLSWGCIIGNLSLAVLVLVVLVDGIAALKQNHS